MSEEFDRFEAAAAEVLKVDDLHGDLLLAKLWLKEILAALAKCPTRWCDGVIGYAGDPNIGAFGQRPCPKHRPVVALGPFGKQLPVREVYWCDHYEEVLEDVSLCLDGHGDQAGCGDTFLIEPEGAP